MQSLSLLWAAAIPYQRRAYILMQTKQKRPYLNFAKKKVRGFANVAAHPPQRAAVSGKSIFPRKLVLYFIWNLHFCNSIWRFLKNYIAKTTRPAAAARTSGNADAWSMDALSLRQLCARRAHNGGTIPAYTLLVLFTSAHSEAVEQHWIANWTISSEFCSTLLKNNILKRNWFPAMFPLNSKTCIYCCFIGRELCLSIHETWHIFIVSPIVSKTYSRFMVCASFQHVSCAWR